MMKKYYHFTSLENLESILEEGLKPGYLVKKRMKSWSEKLIGYNPTDKEYLYLFKGDTINLERIKANLSMLASTTEETYSLLEINIPNKFPVTIDYDQFLILIKIDDATFKTSFLKQPYFNPNKEDLTRLDIAKKIFKEFNIAFDTALSEKNIIKYMKKIDKKLWNKKNGSYRTKKIVEPIYLIHIGNFSKKDEP